MNNLRFYLNRGYYCTALLECAMPELLYETIARDNPNPIDPFYQITRTKCSIIPSHLGCIVEHNGNKYTLRCVYTIVRGN